MSGPWREVIAEWQGGLAFLGSNATGGTVQMNSFDDKAGLSPMELLLASLAGCTGSDVASILEKKHKSLENFIIKVQGKRAEEHPKVYTEINILYLLWGEDLDRKSVEQAIQLSQESIVRLVLC
jgi:putative redox protein